MVELVDKGMKTVIITLLHMLRKLDEKFNYTMHRQIHEKYEKDPIQIFRDEKYQCLRLKIYSMELRQFRHCTRKNQ